MSDATFFFMIAALCFVGVALLKLKVTKTRNMLYRERIGIIHGPGPVLVENSSWRTWNGVFITIGKTTYWIEVR